jgi:23S rRNA pseudouridine2605 synthase
MRLNRYLAACGLGSRRACEQLIRDGRVSINGHFIRELSTTVSEGDQVRVAGRQLSPPMESVVIALNKPKGVLSTRSDERGRETIYSLVPKKFGRLFHVGRLDKDSEGLILLTNDGALSRDLSHPTQKVEKEYEVTLDAPLDAAVIPRLTGGLSIEGRRVRMERVHILVPNVVRVVLTQGMKRQIRVMFFRVGLDVKRLVRVRIGPLQLGALKPGHWRPLQKSEIAALRKPAKVEI